MATCQRQQRAKVNRLPVQMHRQNDFGARRDGRLQQGRVEVVGARVDVHVGRLGVQQCHGLGGGDVGEAGGDDFVARPDRIEAAYVRLLQGGNPTLYTDYMLERILAREDYSRITLKKMASFPSVYFYDSAYPLGYIYPWPLPNAQYELHVVTRTILSRIDVAAPGANYVIPDEYNAAIKWNAARRLRANRLFDR